MPRLADHHHRPPVVPATAVVMRCRAWSSSGVTMLMHVCRAAMARSMCLRSRSAAESAGMDAAIVHEAGGGVGAAGGSGR